MIYYSVLSSGALRVAQELFEINLLYLELCSIIDNTSTDQIFKQHLSISNRHYVLYPRKRKILQQNDFHF